MRNQEEFYYHAFYKAPPSEVLWFLKRFFDEENCTDNGINQIGSDIFLESISNDKFSFFDHFLGKVEKCEWLLKKTSNNETILLWHPEIQPYTKYFHGVIQVVLSIVLLFLWFSYDAPEYISFLPFSEDLKKLNLSLSNLIIVPMVIVCALHVGFVMWLGHTQSFKVSDKWARYFKENSIIKWFILHRKAHKPYGWPWFLAYFVGCMALVAHTFDYNAIRWIDYTLLILLPLFTSFFVLSNGNGRDIYRIGLFSILAVANFSLLLFALSPFIIKLTWGDWTPAMIEVLRKSYDNDLNPDLLMKAKESIQNLTQYGPLSLFTLYLLLFYYFFSGLIAPVSKMDKETSLLRNQYTEFALSVPDTEYYRKRNNDLTIKIIGLSFAIFLFSIWGFAFYNILGNIIYFFVDFTAPGIIMIGYHDWTMLLILLSFGKSLATGSLSIFILAFFVFPAIFVFIILLLVILNNLCSGFKVILEKELKPDLKSKFDELLKLVADEHEDEIVISIIDSNQINAFAQHNLNPFTKMHRIFVTRAALKKLSVDQLLCLFAHERGHVVEKNFYKVSFVMQISKFLIGSVPFLTLYFDIPKEELNADRTAVNYLKTKFGDEAIKTYCGFLFQYGNCNPALSTNITERMVKNWSMGFFDGNENNRSTPNEKTLFANLKINMITNFKQILDFIFLGNSIQYVHPSPQARIKAIQDYFG